MGYKLRSVVSGDVTVEWWRYGDIVRCIARDIHGNAVTCAPEEVRDLDGED